MPHFPDPLGGLSERFLGALPVIRRFWCGASESLSGKGTGSAGPLQTGLGSMGALGRNWGLIDCLLAFSLARLFACLFVCLPFFAWFSLALRLHFARPTFRLHLACFQLASRLLLACFPLWFLLLSVCSSRAFSCFSIGFRLLFSCVWLGELREESGRTHRET